MIGRFEQQLRKNRNGLSLSGMGASKIATLQKLLLKIWSEKNVQEYYQNIILNYLDHLDPSEVEKEISREVKLTHEGQSPCFYLQDYLQKRKRALDRLGNLIKASESIKPSIPQKLFSQVCSQLSNLRQTNLLAAQCLVNLHKEYAKDAQEGVSSHCRKIFHQLDQENNFLKESFLAEFMYFQQGYDPFFHFHYDMQSRWSQLQRHPCLDKVFNINISYSCRMIKARKQILDMLSYGGGERENKFLRSPEGSGRQNKLKSQPFSTLIPRQSHEKIQQYKNKNEYGDRSDQGIDQRKRTSVNFRKKTLSLQQAKEKDSLAKIFSPNVKRSLEKPGQLINREQFNDFKDGRKNVANILPIYRQIRPQLFNEEYIQNTQDDQKRRRLKYNSEVESERDQYFKLVPIKYRITRKKQSKPIYYDEDEDNRIQNKKYFTEMDENISLPSNARRKLIPIAFKKRRNNNQMSPQDTQMEEQTLQKRLIPQQKSFYKQNKMRQQKYQPNHYRGMDTEASPLKHFLKSQKFEEANSHNPQISNTPKNNYNQKRRLPNDQSLESSQRSIPLIKEINMTKLKNSPANKAQKNGDNKKQIKMKPGKFLNDQIMSYLRSHKIQISYSKSTLQNPKWEQGITKSQSYINQFYINSDLAVISVCMALPEGDYLIKLWGRTQKCDEETSFFLFKKYLEYLQKSTACKQIYYNGQQIKELSKNGFSFKKDRVYVRLRSSPIVNKQRQFLQFLSLKCSNICFNQEKSSINVLYSEEIQQFTGINAFVIRPIAEVSKSALSKNIQMLVKISQEIQDVETLNKLLQDQEFDTYQATTGLNIKRINALRLKLETPFRGSFVAGDGYFKFTGDQVYKNVIVRIGCLRFNSFLYFGKGYKEADNFLKDCGKIPKRSIEFSVKMFNKQLYGRTPGKGIQQLGCYGNWEISLSWQDELQGRIRHSMTNCENFGPETFFVGVEIETEIIYCFQVKQDDFLF